MISYHMPRHHISASNKQAAETTGTLRNADEPACELLFGSLSGQQYRVTRMKAHPGENSLVFENIFTGCASVRGCAIYRTPGDQHYARQPRSWGVC